MQPACEDSGSPADDYDDIRSCYAAYAQGQLASESAGPNSRWGGTDSELTQSLNGANLVSSSGPASPPITPCIWNLATPYIVVSYDIVGPTIS